LSCKSGRAQPLELRLEQALGIDITDDFQPSGLLLRGDRILTVSDKHDDAVFEIVRGETNATLRTFVSLSPRMEGPLDFEGITADEDSALLLASEAHNRVLRVESTGRASWVTAPLETIGGSVGLLRERNAGLEGITRLPNGRLLLAAERGPRGLLELQGKGNAGETSPEARAWAMPSSIYPIPAGRQSDFSDLTTTGGDVYVLERNSHLVVRLERTAERWEEREAWSYARTENDARFSYRDSRYGVGEGLAIDRDHVYIVTDNNRLPRTADADDRRPQLFVFARPAR
jgi:uncharacterized protein YjiK